MGVDQCAGHLNGFQHLDLHVEGYDLGYKFLGVTIGDYPGAVERLELAVSVRRVSDPPGADRPSIHFALWDAAWKNEGRPEPNEKHHKLLLERAKERLKEIGPEELLSRNAIVWIDS